MRDRERETQTQTNKQTHRQTHRHKTQTHTRFGGLRQRQSQAYRQMDRG